MEAAAASPGGAETAENLLMAPDRPYVVVSGAFFMEGMAHGRAAHLKRARGRLSVMTGLSLLAVFIGGGAGATCRYGLGRVIGARYAGAFPPFEGRLALMPHIGPGQVRL